MNILQALAKYLKISRLKIEIIYFNDRYTEIKRETKTIPFLFKRRVFFDIPEGAVSFTVKVEAE